MSDTFTVESIQCRAHQSRSGRTSFLLEYEVREREQPIYDHLCVGYSGYPGEKADSRWLELRGQEPPPRTVEEALERKCELADPIALTVAEDAKGFERIIAMRFADDLEPEPSLEADREFLKEGGTAPVVAKFDFSKFKG